MDKFQIPDTNLQATVDSRSRCSPYLPHPWVLFHFGHGPEQAWRGGGWGHLQDAAEVGGVDRRLLRVEQCGLVLFPLGGQVELLSCPGNRKTNRLKRNHCISCNMGDFFPPLSNDVVFQTKRID